MNEIKQYKELLPRSIQHKQGKEKISIADNRIESVRQNKLVRAIQNGYKKEPFVLSAPVIQAVWQNDGESGRVKWDEEIDGVTWYSNGDGLMWFEITSPNLIERGKQEDYEGLRGVEKARSWIEWNKISIEPCPEFLNIDRPEYDFADERWKQWDSYVNIVIGESLQQDAAADVHIDPDFNPDSVEGLQGSEELSILKDYIAKFKIVSREEYNIKLWEMAEKMASLGRYTCIVSEPGKSNFWVTARVLKRVKALGGNPPERIISVPTKEKGIMDGFQSSIISIDLSNAGDIVFLDDGSYSGSQLLKLVNKVMKKARNKVRLGLVARSKKADERLAKYHENFLNDPILIECYEHEKMKRVQTKLRLKSHISDIGMPDEGDHLLGLYYKVPDYASVRTRELTDVKDATGKTAVAGYSVGSYGNATDKSELVGATEPYKGFSGHDATEYGLEIAATASPAFGLGMRDVSHSSIGPMPLPKRTEAPLLSRLSHVSFPPIVPPEEYPDCIKTTDPSSILAPENINKVYVEEPKNQEMMGNDGEIYIYVGRKMEKGEFYFKQKE